MNKIKDFDSFLNEQEDKKIINDDIISYLDEISKKYEISSIIKKNVESVIYELITSSDIKMKDVEGALISLLDCSDNEAKDIIDQVLELSGDKKVNEAKKTDDAIRLDLTFGKDQVHTIDALIEKFKHDKKIVQVKKDEGKDHFKYELYFKQAYDIYLFGHTQAKMPFKIDRGE